MLAVDDYHLEPEDLASVRAALLRFIDGQLAAGDQAVVAAASGSLGALQQFTADREVLRHAVARLRAQNRSFRPPLDVPRITDYQAELIEQGDQEALSLAVEEIMATEPASRQNYITQTRNEQRVRTMARQIVASTAHVTSLTLSALERLVEGLHLGSASQWVEVPDRARQRLSLSSVLLVTEGEGTAAAPSATARGSVSFDRPRQMEASRRFPRGGHLDYLVVVYDRGKSASSVDVVVERQLLSGSSVLTRSAPGPVVTDGATGLPVVTGRLRLDSLPPGDYELRLVVSDRSARATTTRSLRFTVE